MMPKKCALVQKSLFLLLLLTLCSTFSFAATGKITAVENLKVTDIPDDDGSGLQVSWKPLPKEARIIEYRIYRGVTPDTMFYISKIPVNAKTGVPAEEMYFYDKSFNYFLDVRAPGKLKKEKQQAEGSPLYQRMPRDIKIYGPLLSQYSILGVVPKDEFYYKTNKVEVESTNPKGEKETNTYAGLKLRQLSMYKKLKPNKDYYYTVVPVNKQRKFFPYAKIVKGTPRENSPEVTKEFHSAVVTDIDRVNFEWSLPMWKDDISHHSVYMLKNEDIEKFNKFVEQSKLKEEYALKALEDPNFEAPEIKDPVTNPAELVFRRQTAYPYTSKNYAIVDLKDGKIIDEDNGINVEFNVTDADKYSFVFSLLDYSKSETFSKISAPQQITSKDLPVIPEFQVQDRENDKGDYNKILWGKPVCYITKSVILDEEKTELRVNYELVVNKKYKVKNIYFEVYNSEGKLIDKINEFYQDNKFVVKAPEGTDILKGLSFKMTFKTNNDKEIGKDYGFTQSISYSDVSKSLEPNKLMFGQEDVNNYFYYIYKRSYASNQFRLSKKISGYQREIDDNVSYEKSMFVGVSKFDVEKDMVLVNSAMTVVLDHETKKSVRTSVYASVNEKNNKTNHEMVETYTAKLDSAKSDAEKKAYMDAIAHYKTQYTNKTVVEANKIKNDKARVQFLAKIREADKRRFEYMIVKTDGKAVVSETPVYKKDGVQYFLPVSNMFNKDKLPMLIATLVFGFLVFIYIRKARLGHDLYVRPIAGIQEIDNAIGRATEMGKPILFVPGLSGISDVATLAGLAILGRVAKKAAEYDTKILVPVRDYIVLPIAQEIVKESHYEAGRPDSYDKNSVFFITTSQFAFVAGVNGVMVREQTATNFYMGMFWAESLIMTETGNSTGAIQISGTDAKTQIPFFITTCDYTLIGEELYAASAYLAREPLMLGTLKAQDYFKFIILAFIIAGTLLSTFQMTFLINAFPEK